MDGLGDRAIRREFAAFLIDANSNPPSIAEFNLDAVGVGAMGGAARLRRLV
jgi:hypothetical protein